MISERHRVSVPAIHGERSQADIEEALARIPPEFRAATILVDLAGMSLEGAADTLEIPIGTVKSRVFRARRLLAEELGNLGPPKKHLREEP